MFPAFHERYPEIGVTEYRTVTPFGAEGTHDTYMFMEHYCDEEGCDCRRVIVHVYSMNERTAGRIGFLASLTFGWESEQFYRDWARHPPLTAAELADLKGPAVQLLAPQTARSEEMLAHFRLLLADRSYVDRIRRHYAMIQGRAAPGERSPAARPLNRKERRSRGRSVSA